MKKLRWLGTHYIFGNNILSTVIEARVPICLFAVIPWMINNNYVGGASLGHVVSKWQEIGNCRNIVVVRENSIQSHFLHRLHLLSADSTWQPGKNSRSHTMCSFLSKLIIFGLQFHGTHNPEKWTGSKMALRDPHLHNCLWRESRAPCGRCPANLWNSAAVKGRENLLFDQLWVIKYRAE